jgi:uncharacterized protein
MRLLIFSDIHGDKRSLQRLLDIEADYYFAAGDMVTWARGFDQIGPLLAARADKMYVLPGNHESIHDIQILCSRFGLSNFHQESMRIGEVTIAGLGYSNPTPFDTPGEYSETELEERLQPFAGIDPLVMICHCPPRGTALDRIREGVHAGSSAMLKFIETTQPRYFFCGHIHESEGVTVQIGATTAMNVGKKGFLLEL